MQFYSKKSNAQRAALRKSTVDGQLYKVEIAKDGRYFLTQIKAVSSKKSASKATSNPAAAGAAAANADDAQRDTLRAAGAPIPASLTGVIEGAKVNRAKMAERRAAVMAMADAIAPIAATPGRPISQKAAALEAARRGVLPTPPDFTAATHKPYRAKLAKLMALVEARDADGLAAVAINPTSTSPKALIKYRDLAIMAIRTGKAA